MNTTSTTGKIIIINGPSSAGKTTLALALQEQFETPFIRFSFDLFLDHNALPMTQIRSGTFAWDTMRPAVFNGLHQCLPALASAGNNLIFDHIIETKAWLNDLIRLLAGFDVFFVGLHCSLAELERREIQRGNRRTGEAQADLQTVHTFGAYDLELNSENAAAENAKLIIAEWTKRKRLTAFDTMAQEMNIAAS